MDTNNTVAVKQESDDPAPRQEEPEGAHKQKGTPQADEELARTKTSTPESKEGGKTDSDAETKVDLESRIKTEDRP